MKSDIILFITGTWGVIFLIALFILAILPDNDKRSELPDFPPSDEEEIQKYLSGRIKGGGQNGKKEKEKTQPESAKGGSGEND